MKPGFSVQIEQLRHGLPLFSLKLVGVFFLVFVAKGHTASLAQDLNSKSQEIRDAAAKLLRQTYSPPPRTNWDRLLNSLKLGTSETNVMDQLRSMNLRFDGGAGSGNTITELCRLDDLWILEC